MVSVMTTIMSTAASQPAFHFNFNMKRGLNSYPLARRPITPQTSLLAFKLGEDFTTTIQKMLKLKT
jgi:hypothetical protein